MKAPYRGWDSLVQATASLGMKCELADRAFEGFGKREYCIHDIIRNYIIHNAMNRGWDLLVQLTTNST